jgi:hypothetical protein
MKTGRVPYDMQPDLFAVDFDHLVGNVGGRQFGTLLGAGQHLAGGGGAQRFQRRAAFKGLQELGGLRFDPGQAGGQSRACEDGQGGCGDQVFHGDSPLD